MQRLLLAAGVLLVQSAAVAAPQGSLRAGAARVDITPAAGAALPMSGYGSRTEGHQGIHDRLYARAIVVDDRSVQVAVAVCDLIGFSHDYWKKISARLSEATGIPVERILLAGTHTHGAPALGPVTEDEQGRERTAYISELESQIQVAVRQAQANLQPARMGFGRGKASVNINRRARMAEGDWWLGYNPEGPSDKTVAVVKFESLAGEPIAFLVNYPVHGTVLGPKNLLITADLPGAVSRRVEEHYGDKAVAIYTAGASGDQDPIYRVGTDFGQQAILGRLVGEEVLRVAGSIRTSSTAHLSGAQRVVTCPGRKPDGGAQRRKDGNYVFLDADPVDIRLSVLMLNHIAVTGVSGEVLTLIGTRLKKESPFSATIMVTHANGSSGYLPNDAAYDQLSYEIVTTRVKQGCAEDAIVNTLLGMMDEL